MSVSCMSSDYCRNIKPSNSYFNKKITLTETLIYAAAHAANCHSTSQNTAVFTAHCMISKKLFSVA